jgi:ribosomal protein L7/L12
MTMVWILIAVGVLLTLVGVLVVRSRRAPGAPRPSRSFHDVPTDLAALDDTAFRSRLVQEIDAGRTVTAIRWVRARTGLGLKESKDFVDALIAGDVGASLEPRIDDVRGLDDVDFNAHLLVELAAGRKLEAIKLVRERTGLGLKEAKDAIEALERGG